MCTDPCTPKHEKKTEYNTASTLGFVKLSSWRILQAIRKENKEVY